MSELTSKMLGDLAQPFDAASIQWKPGATSKDKSKALALAYADTRDYLDRLDQVAGPNWSDDYQVLDGGRRVVCRLTICGTTRTDVGECADNDQNTTTSASAQAFKRACSKFGLGRFLYRTGRQWVEYDAQRKTFTPAALAQLRRSIGTNGNTPSPSKPTNTAKSNGPRTWAGAVVGAVVSSGLAEHARHAVAMLNKSTLPVDADPPVAVAWARRYRAARDGGANSDDAAKAANG